MAPDPKATGVTHFAVHGHRLMFFTPRDFDPVTRVVLATSFTAGQLTRVNGEEVVVPAKQGGRYDDRPWVVAT